MSIRWSEHIARIHVVVLAVLYLFTVSASLVLYYPKLVNMWLSEPFPRWALSLALGGILNVTLGSSALLVLIGIIAWIVDARQNFESPRLLVVSTFAAFLLCALHVFVVPVP